MSVSFLATARTPFGAFGGSMRSLTTAGMAARAMTETLRRADLDPSLLQEIVLGCALPAGCGPNPARQAALKAGLACGAYTLNMGQGSGLKAILLAAQTLAMGPPMFSLAGGADSSSRAPYLVPNARWGTRIGGTEILDSLWVDGLWDASKASGLATEVQVQWAQTSLRKNRGLESRDCFPVSWNDNRGPKTLTMDEDPRNARISFPAHIAPPADGAAMVLLGNTAGPRPLGRLLGAVETSQGWASAIRDLLTRTGLSFETVDRWELEERSAAQLLDLFAECPELDPAKVNVRGGSLALGDPIGASGARLLISLLHSLEDEDLDTGIVATPAGQGLALAMAITRS